ncbi:hypothetical protein PLESTF_000332700 [Pleodorina starrii]|nr:hypothetical protein PLESTF_000332700 [Pleodorina starrii]
MDAPANLPELVSEFAAITGASPLVADHYLSACNYDLNRAVEFFFEHPPAPTQAGPRPGGNAPDEEAAAMGALGDEADLAGEGLGQGGGVSGPAAADDDEELQRALAASMTDAGPGPRRGGAGSAGAGRLAQRRDEEDVQVIDDEDEELPDADEMLAAMARQREAAVQAEREARGRMEEMMNRMLGGVSGRPPGLAGTSPPPGYPRVAADPLGGLASIFPGMGTGMPMPMMPGMGLGGPLLPPRAGFPGGPTGRSGRGPEGGSRARDGSGGGGAGGAGQAQRRRVEVRSGGGDAVGSAGAGAAAAAAASGRGGGGGGWEDDEELQLPEGMSRHDLEEARMMEAALLGVPYEGPLHAFGSGRAGGGAGGGAEDREVAPEVWEHRELRWDQDRAYEESLAADRAKEQAAARAKAEAEAREREQREAEAAAERAATEEAARVEALVAAKAGRLPQEPPSSDAGAITVMVRLPDGSRHSRRFARGDRLSSLFDFVDVELDSAAKTAAAGAAAAAGGGGGDAAAAAQPPQASLKPGTYNLVAQFPRRVFAEEDSGGQTFEEAGLAGGGGAAFFIEQKGG